MYIIGVKENYYRIYAKKRFVRGGMPEIKIGKHCISESFAGVAKDLSSNTTVKGVSTK
jgi:hypothetical protein